MQKSCKEDKMRGGGGARSRTKFQGVCRRGLKNVNTKELMHCHSGTNNRAPQWTFTDLCKPEVRPGAREESASPAWLAKCEDKMQGGEWVFRKKILRGYAGEG